MPDNKKDESVQRVHLLLNADGEIEPEMNQFITLAKQHGYGVQEVKKVLPSRLMKGLRHFFLGQEKLRARAPQCKIPNCRKHLNKHVPGLKRGCGRKLITDTLILKKKQKLKKQKQLEKKKNNKQFRIFGITFGGGG